MGDLLRTPYEYVVGNVYEVWQKSDETDFYLPKCLFFSNINLYPLQNSSLEQLHTNGDVVPTFGSSAGSLKSVWSSACQLHSFGRFLKFLL